MFSKPSAIAMRLREPIVLMASGNADARPLTVGFSNSSAFPPPGLFISRSAHSVISSSVATGCVMRVSSPTFSSAATNAVKEENAMSSACHNRPPGLMQSPAKPGTTMISHTRFFLEMTARFFVVASLLGTALTPRESFARAAPQPIVRICAVQPFATEAPQLTPARLLVTRTGDTTAPLVVNLTLGGSATNGVDYQTIPATLTIPAGQSAANLFIVPKSDALPEGAETVFVAIAASGEYATGAPRAAGARIVDNDLPAARPIFVNQTLPRFFFPASFVSEQRRDRYYRFVVRTATALNVTLTGRAVGNLLADLSADVGLELLDRTGSVVASSDHSGQGAEFLRKTAVAPGEYFLHVFYVGSGEVPDGNGGTTTVNATAFQVALSAGLDWDLVTGNGEAHHVGLRAIRADGRLAAVASSARTWIVTHGRASSPAGFVPLARTMDAAEPGGQILLLDWRTAAAAHSYYDLSEGRWFAAIAARIEPILNLRDLKRDHLNLLGHSWGTYISYEIAHAIGGGDAASRFIALDPALTADNYDVSTADFGAVSLYAWAFWSSPLGSEDVARTADDSFDVNIPSPDVIEQHTGMVELFTSLLRSAGPVANLFHLNRVNAASRIWTTDPSVWDRRISAFGNMPLPPRQATDGFEAKLYATPDGNGGWNAAALDFEPK